MKIGYSGLTGLPTRYTKPTPNQSTSPLLPKSNDAFILEVEKHLDDVSKGRGYLSKGTNRALVEKNYKNGLFLGQSDPAALQLYSGIVSGLKYQQSSRLVAGVEKGNQTVAKLNELNSIDQEKMTQDLIDQFSKTPPEDPQVSKEA